MVEGGGGEVHKFSSRMDFQLIFIAWKLQSLLFNCLQVSAFTVWKPCGYKEMLFTV